jgi:hypothetical protein
MQKRRVSGSTTLAIILVLSAACGTRADAETAFDGDPIEPSAAATRQPAPAPIQAGAAGPAHADPQGSATAGFLRYREALQAASGVEEMRPHVTAGWMEYMTQGGANDGSAMLRALRQTQAGEWEVLAEEVQRPENLRQLLAEMGVQGEPTEAEMRAMLQHPMMAQFLDSAILRVRWTRPDGSSTEGDQTMRFEEGRWRYASPLQNMIR